MRSCSRKSAAPSITRASVCLPFCVLFSFCFLTTARSRAVCAARRRRHREAPVGRAARSALERLRRALCCLCRRCHRHRSRSDRSLRLRLSLNRVLSRNYSDSARRPPARAQLPPPTTIGFVHWCRLIFQSHSFLLHISARQRRGTRSHEYMCRLLFFRHSIHSRSFIRSVHRLPLEDAKRVVSLLPHLAMRAQVCFVVASSWHSIQLIR